VGGWEGRRDGGEGGKEVEEVKRGKEVREVKDGKRDAQTHGTSELESARRQLGKLVVIGASRFPRTHSIAAPPIILLIIIDNH